MVDNSWQVLTLQSTKSNLQLIRSIHDVDDHSGFTCDYNNEIMHKDVLVWPAAIWQWSPVLETRTILQWQKLPLEWHVHNLSHQQYTQSRQCSVFQSLAGFIEHAEWMNKLIGNFILQPGPLQSAYISYLNVEWHHLCSAKWFCEGLGDLAAI